MASAKALFSPGRNRPSPVRIISLHLVVAGWDIGFGHGTRHHRHQHQEGVFAIKWLTWA
jgi:hypothetical protein